MSTIRESRERRHSTASIFCSDLKFSWPDGTDVLGGVNLSVGPGRTGIVGANGCGKSTLLRLLTGELEPTAGTAQTDGRLAYLPQDVALHAADRVDEVLGIAAVRRALRDLEIGIVDAERLDRIGDEWDVEQRARVMLDRLGLPTVGLDRTVGELSGGEAMSVALAARLLAAPDVLLLDEPTNNLDLDRRRHLYDAVEAFGGVLVVVSHDRELLERMDQIVEVRERAVRVYGGAYSEYEAAVQREQEAAARALRAAEGEVRKEQRERVAAQVVLARRQRMGRKHEAEKRVPRVVAHERKGQAQVSAGKLRAVHNDRLSASQERRDEAQAALREEERIRIDLPATAVPTRRMVLELRGLRVRYGESLWDRELDLTVQGPERIALVGPNGGGKTTLLRCLAGLQAAGGGEVMVGVAGVGYLPQRLDVLDPDPSVVQNLQRVAPSASQNELRARLARFAFRAGDADQPAGTLSGGERFRAVLATLLCADPPPQLLLLDEPTNNLDLVSAAQLRSALEGYEGAFIVASHDLAFLREIGITRWLALDRNLGLREASAPFLD